MLRGAHLGARPDAKRVMVLLTDGQTTDRWVPNYLPVIERLSQTDILRIGKQHCFRYRLLPHDVYEWYGVC